jgi:hypothetical protein
MTDITPTPKPVGSTPAISTRLVDNTKPVADEELVPGKWATNKGWAIGGGLIGGAIFGVIGGCIGDGLGKRAGRGGTGSVIGAILGAATGISAAYGIGILDYDRAPIAPYGSTKQTVQDAETLYNLTKGEGSSDLNRTRIRLLIEQINVRGYPLHEALVEAATFANDDTNGAAILDMLDKKYGAKT